MPPLTYHYRGKRTLIILLVLRLIPAVLFLFALIILIAFQGPITASIEESLGDQAPNFIMVYDYIMSVGFFFFIAFTGLMIVVGWFEYITFRYVIDAHAFKTREGIFNIRETSILYSKIQKVDIDRPLIYRFFGMSKVVILTAGSEDEDKNEPESFAESEIYIDLIEKEQALQIQHELLTRSHVQPVHIVSQSSSVNTPSASTDLHMN
jgi:uncharacterized membrane protein YdbT with pleckstrin-like domain